MLAHQCALEANSILLSIAWADKERHHSQNDSAKFVNAKKTLDLKSQNQSFYIFFKLDHKAVQEKIIRESLEFC